MFISKFRNWSKRTSLALTQWLLFTCCVCVCPSVCQPFSGIHSSYWNRTKNYLKSRRTNICLASWRYVWIEMLLQMKKKHERIRNYFIREEGDDTSADVVAFGKNSTTLQKNQFPLPLLRFGLLISNYLIEWFYG